MVLRSAAKFGLQQLASRYGGRATRYAKEEYGQIAGSIVGTAIGIAAGGDFIGSISKNFGGDKPPNERNPPFGYFDQTGRDGLNGPSNGAFHKTYRPDNFVYRNNRRYKRKYTRKCSCKTGRRLSNRSRRRKYR